ncbi:hypothetical protein CHLNCDRAFT_52424, partial [Chlorella variabilis]
MERRQRPGSAGGPPAQQQAGGRAEGADEQGTLQGLLRRLGAGYEDIYPGAAMGGSARVRAIVVQLKDEDEVGQLAGLTELCEFLSISTEDTLAAFPTEQVVPLLALEKLSHEHPARLLEAGALVAVLSYVDFFQTGVQRVAVATAANMCRGLSGAHAEAATAAAPILINLLQYQDAKIVDSACLALTRIAQAFSRSPRHLEALCALGLVGSIVQMVGVSESGGMTSQLQVPTFYGLLKILATMAAGSHVVAEALMEAGVSSTLRNLLATSSLLSTTAVSPANVLRSTDQLGDLVALAAALLPPIPEPAAAMARQDAPPSTSAAAAGAKQAGGEESEEVCQRTRFVHDHPALLQKFSADLLPLMIQVYSSSVTPQVKRQCLTTIAKMLHFNTAHTLAALLEELPAAALVAALLGARDSTVAAYGMQMAEILIEKLPDVYHQYFLKEGVVHAIDQLAATPPAAAAAAADAAAAGGAAQESSGGAAGLAARVGRRLSGGGRPASRAADKDAGEAAAAPRAAAGDALRAAVGARARRFHARYFTDGKGHALSPAAAAAEAAEAALEALAAAEREAMEEEEMLVGGGSEAHDSEEDYDEEMEGGGYVEGEDEEYDEEGLGPTLEFYTLLSHELQRKSLGIWRHDDAAAAAAAAPPPQPPAALAEGAKPAADAALSGPGPLEGELDAEGGQLSEGVRAGELVAAPHGLFPAPLPPGRRGDDGKPAAYFRLLGRAVAKALQDCRLLDLPLSPLLYRLALQRRVDLYDVAALDPAL